MDDGSLSMRNWGYYEPSSLKGHLGLQLMSNMPDREPKPLITGANGAFHHRICGVSESPIPMDYMRDAWISNRDKFFNMLPSNPTLTFLAEPSGAHPAQVLPQPNSPKEDDTIIEKEIAAPLKKRPKSKSQKSPKPKKPKKEPRLPKDGSAPSAQRAMKNTEVIINGIDMDISGIPIPVCSCTGARQQCYRWGSGGWQSACCTTGISVYPLPMSTKRRGARIAGRKMSLGAFKKVLEKLAAEGYNFSNAIDLKTHWAKHGTNKFVTIR